MTRDEAEGSRSHRHEWIEITTFEDAARHLSRWVCKWCPVTAEEPLPDIPSVTAPLPHSDWHVIHSIGVEHRGEDIPIDQAGAVRGFIPGIREMVLTIVGDFTTDKIDVVEVNGRRFKPEA